VIRLIPALLVALALLPVEIRTQQLPNIDVVAGRRADSRALANGREAIVSLRAHTLITTARD